MNNIIFTMTEKDDLYIIGDFQSEMMTIIDEHLPNRIIGITDDYHSISIKGKKSNKIATRFETVGCFLLCTKTEWKEIVDLLLPYFITMEHGEPYAAIIEDYQGDVAVDVLDDDLNSILLDFDINEDLMYQEYKEGTDADEYVVLLESGYHYRLTFLEELYGFRKELNYSKQYIYKCYDCDETFTEDVFENHRDHVKDTIGYKKTEEMIWKK